MRMLNEKELSLVNGGILCYTPPTHEERVRIDAMHRLEEWQKWVRKEKRKMEGLADIRMRAAEDALKAAMRIDRAEAEIKAAQRAAMGL
ncbi:MAG: hypothetical protein IKE24_10615 [Clostridia bacterium]|nr:hypothetical protein [Clostridia bacterium]